MLACGRDVSGKSYEDVRGTLQSMPIAILQSRAGAGLAEREAQLHLSLCGRS